MKKQSVFNENESKNQKQRGFFIALGISLVAIIVAVYVGVSGTLNQFNDNPLDGDLNSQNIDSQSVEQVDKTQSNIELPSDDENIETTSSEVSSKNEDDKQTLNQSVVTNDTSSQDVQTTAKAQTFMMPLEGDIINEYSNGELVKSKTLNEWRTHDGVDIKAEVNTPVKATTDGTVLNIEEDPMWGVKVTLSHDNDYKSFYCGLKTSVPVKVGQDVKVGDIVGYVGNTAEIEIAEESHLHFGMQQNDLWVDPVVVVGK